MRMLRILVYRPDAGVSLWVEDLQAALPDAQIVAWREGERIARCDYAVIWSPPPALLDVLAEVKAIFLMGAGADAILKHGDALPSTPIIRVGDAGMGIQMIEYVTHAVLRYYRRFDDYEKQARSGVWAPLPLIPKKDFSVGVLGAGKLGCRVLEGLAPLGFPLRSWSRSPKEIAGVRSFHGSDQLDAFLEGTRALVCMLPLTPETSNLLDRARLARLPQGSYLINVARGAHVSEPDLMALVKNGHIAGATLDVFRNEPLPGPHPFWEEPRITITPHISGTTVRSESIVQIIGKIDALERGERVDDVVDRGRGY
ncbi:MAG: 2-hydroxyacid dehydrogenase [Gammaproteobacteria bacterium]